MKEPVAFESIIEHHLPDHEILLSFQNDSGEERFMEWWWQEGKELFDKYCEELEE